MIIDNLESLKFFFNKKIQTPIFGACVFAFDRLGPEDFLPHYELLTLRYSLDTEIIEKDIPLLSLEKGMGTKHINAPRNSTTILNHPETKKYLKKFKNPAIIVYKTSEKMEQICAENNWKIIGIPSKFGKKLFENKVNFRRLLEELGISVPPGQIKKIKNLNYGNLINKYGLPFVIQHPSRGGGKGTFFIQDKKTFDDAINKLTHSYDEDKDLIKEEVTEDIIIARFIKGSSPSMTVCVTKHGIISTNLQHQILDVPELFNPEKGSGLFCGHDWTSSDFSEEINNQAYEIAEKIGNYFKSQGYRGIFGLDFVLDEKDNKLYVTETNPRLLGSFPVVSMAQTLNNEPPILAFHILEYLEVDYEINIKEINKLMRQPKKGAQMILHNLTGNWTHNHSEVRAGVYELKNESKFKYLRPGYKLSHLKNENEFIISDGVLQKGSHYSPNRRLGRILTLDRVLDKAPSKLNDKWSLTAKNMYNNFNLKKIKFLKIKKIFLKNYLNKG